MSYTNFNMRLDDSLRAKTYPILETYGLTPSQAVRMFFNQIAQTGKVPLTFDWAEMNTPNQATLQSLQQGQADYQAGKLQGYQVENAQELTQVLKELTDE